MVGQLVAALIVTEVPAIECPAPVNVAVTGRPVLLEVVWSNLSLTDAEIKLSSV